MTSAKRKRLRLELASLRGRGGVGSAELAAFAEALDRTRKKGGRHLTYVSSRAGARPVQIPCHGNKDVHRYLKDAILDILEEDLVVAEAEEDHNPEDNGA